MANQIALRIDVMTLLLASMKPADPYKAKIYNESKNVAGQTMTFVFSNPKLALTLPASRKTPLFMLSR